jgi:hypothetical protein
MNVHSSCSYFFSGGHLFIFAATETSFVHCWFGEGIFNHWCWNPVTNVSSLLLPRNASDVFLHDCCCGWKSGLWSTITSLERRCFIHQYKLPMFWIWLFLVLVYFVSDLQHFLKISSLSSWEYKPRVPSLLKESSSLSLILKRDEFQTLMAQWTRGSWCRKEMKSCDWPSIATMCAAVPLLSSKIRGGCKPTGQRH